MDLSKIEYLGIDRVLRRGTGEVLQEGDDYLLVWDRLSDSYHLACDDPKMCLDLLDRHAPADIDLLMVSDLRCAEVVYDKYRFQHKLDCYQVAYLGAMPALNTTLDVRPATQQDLPLITRHYDLLGEPELRRLVERQTLLMGFCQGEPVGFVGEHLEGSMGLLYVFPPHRRKGYAAQLETIYITKTMLQGYIPFGQVEVGNAASIRLQQKLGLTISSTPICWMWKD